MNKYSIEYPKHKLSVRLDGEDNYLNLIINHYRNEYVFVQFVYGSSKISEAAKKVPKLREENDALYLVICMIIDKFVTESKKNELSEFKNTILPEKGKDKNNRIEDYPSIYVCTNNNYYNTSAGIMLYNRIKKKLPLIYFNF